VRARPEQEIKYNGKSRARAPGNQAGSASAAPGPPPRTVPICCRRTPRGSDAVSKQLGEKLIRVRNHRVDQTYGDGRSRPHQQSSFVPQRKKRGRCTARGRDARQECRTTNQCGRIERRNTGTANKARQLAIRSARWRCFGRPRNLVHREREKMLRSDKRARSAMTMKKRNQRRPTWSSSAPPHRMGAISCRPHAALKVDDPRVSGARTRQAAPDTDTQQKRSEHPHDSRSGVGICDDGGTASEARITPMDRCLNHAARGTSSRGKSIRRSHIAPIRLTA